LLRNVSNHLGPGLKEDEVGGTCGTHRGGEGRVVYRILVGRPEGKRQLGRPRRTWEDNIKTDLMDVVIDGAN
jgi:hypothetical protein